MPDPIGLVVPHAGYEYSGPVAATAYAALQARTAVAQPERVALLGPSHFVALRGAAVPAADAWATPLGTVEVDAELQRVAIARGAARDDAPHRRDHALEVQLPFLQRILGSSFRVCPVAIGESETGEVASLIGALADSEAFVIVSTDLSHYHEHRTARPSTRGPPKPSCSAMRAHWSPAPRAATDGAWSATGPSPFTGRHRPEHRPVPPSGECGSGRELRVTAQATSGQYPSPAGLAPGGGAGARRSGTR